VTSTTVNSYMADAAAQLRICAESGVNAVTLSEEALFPWHTSPDIAEELDRIAKQNGVTLTGTGYQDTFWVNMIALLMGTAHRIDSVTGRASWNVDDYGPELATAQQVGRITGQFEEWLRDAKRPPTFGRNVLDALLADTGLRVKSIETKTVPTSPASPSTRGHYRNISAAATSSVSPTSMRSRPKKDRYSPSKCLDGYTTPPKGTSTNGRSRVSPTWCCPTAPYPRKPRRARNSSTASPM
jgi:hypothetical protein